MATEDQSEKKGGAYPSSFDEDKLDEGKVVYKRGEQRSAARLAVVQALYQMEMAAKGLNEVYAEFESFWMGREIEGEQYKPAENKFFRALLAGVVAEQIELDRKVDALLAQGEWHLKRVEAVMRAILRAGAYEVLFRPDTPIKVVISEYVDLAASFSQPDEIGMVNAVLDRLAREASSR